MSTFPNQPDFSQNQPVQINGNKFATGQILKKPVEVVKGRILAGGVQKSPEPCPAPPGRRPEKQLAPPAWQGGGVPTLAGVRDEVRRVWRHCTCTGRSVGTFVCPSFCSFVLVIEVLVGMEGSMFGGNSDLPHNAL
jgi:hypothetical protein